MSVWLKWAAVSGALGKEGIFRKGGSTKRCNALIKQFDEEPTVELPPHSGTHVLDMCTMLVKYLMALKKSAGETLFGALQKELNNSLRDGEDLAVFTAKLMKLPEPNIATVRTLGALLHEASKPEFAATNKMNPSKFAMCMFGTSPYDKRIFEAVIENFREIFPDDVQA